MNTDPMPSDLSADPSPTARIISPAARGARRRRMEEAVRAGKLTRVGMSDVLAEETLPQLAAQSLWLLVISAAVYVVVIGFARQWSHAGQLFGQGSLLARILLLVGINIVGYFVMIPLHEAIHALMMLALGGRPRFGLKLPLAAYCTAPNQLFLRDGYIAVALAPLLALSILALFLAALRPDIAVGLILAVAGNVSGAVGDLAIVRGVHVFSRDTLIADTATGYIAYQVGS